ncbi:MAG: CheR family methyltransferase [Candidatus Dactylopiibacterium sp.]|nr:CheR family methyltransferase [Candidatus Dactylopiibacterium sp.]
MTERSKPLWPPRAPTPQPAAERSPVAPAPRGAASAPAARPGATGAAATPTVSSVQSARQVITDALRRIDTGTREFEFTADDFERVRALIYKRAGISLSAAKQDMVYSRLARRLRARGLRRFGEYLDLLERTHDETEWEGFVNALTTNLTSFFREAHHFEMLAEQMRRSADRRPFRIWCNAASTGEEPYSLAITACEVFGNNPPVEIVASDLDTSVLAHAQKGIYTPDRVERLSRERIQRFFTNAPAEAPGAWRVKPELTRLVSFRQINLLAPTWPLREGFDAIFCRNVMIYFDKPTQYRILQRFVSMLQPRGLLYAGHSENFIHAAQLFRSLGRTVYARADQPAPPP